MEILNLEDIKVLATVWEKPCISIYLRMHDKGKETRQNAIRFKNALNKVKAALEKQPADAANVRDEIEPLGKLLDDGAFWRSQSRGLAVFISPGNSRIYRLPVDFEDLQIVSGRFHLKPVLPLITENFRFYLLAISQNSNRFYRCDRLRSDALNLEKMPKSMEDALKYQLEQRQFQFYTGAPVQRGTSRRASVFHGQGLGADEQNDQLLQYCRLIDAAVYEVLRNETAPLVLAGVERLLAIFKEASDYPNLMPEGIIGNPERISETDLHRQAWQVASAELIGRKREAIEKYNTFKGTGLATADLPMLLRCAFDGRIDRLIVGEGLHQWGRCDENGGNVEIFPGRKHAPGEMDLLDVAACETIMKGGEIFTVEPSQIPEGAAAAAVLRF